MLKIIILLKTTYHSQNLELNAELSIDDIVNTIYEKYKREINS